MSASKGPWRWEEWLDANGTMRLRDEAGDSVLRIHEDEHARMPSEADARLIAAAPTLLEMLKTEHGPPDNPNEAELCPVCRLISHIEGHPRGGEDATPIPTKEDPRDR